MNLPPIRGDHRKALVVRGAEFIERGWSDKRIAKELGCHPDTVRRWRHAFNIDAPCKVGAEDWYAETQQDAIETNSRVMTLCAAGLTDAEGAEVLGVSENAFAIRRWRLGIKRNLKSRDGRRHITARGERAGEF
jgi:transposase